MREAILKSQGIYSKQSTESGVTLGYKAIKAMGYVQIDSISVVERAHHHTLWNRTQRYQPEHIEVLLKDRKIFEYWSHAAAYLPMSDYRFSLPRKTAIARGDTHWHRNVDKKLMASVVERISIDGPLQARDFKDIRQKSTGWWDWKPAKIALEQLYMEGELMVLRREGFQKVYDLTERVLPPGINCSSPTQEAYYQHLITRYLTAHAVGTVEQISYLLKGIKKPVNLCCANMLEDGRLISVIIDGHTYYALPTLSNLLSKKLNLEGVKILSPFDNLLIQRKRTKALFDYDYQIECYLPAAKRKVGYFSLPLLWGSNFAGRMDAKMDRKSGTLNVQHLHLETLDRKAFIESLKPALKAFLAFNKASSIRLAKITSRYETLSSMQCKQMSNSLRV